MKISCGILFYTKSKQILLGHATGMHHWDIFKGVQEDGETFEETAIRETVEECGVKVNKSELNLLGHFKYMKGKDLVIFSYLIDDIDLDSLVCSTFVTLEGKDPFPEMDNYSYFSKDDCFDVMSNSLCKLFSAHEIFDKIP